MKFDFRKRRERVNYQRNVQCQHIHQIADIHAETNKTNSNNNHITKMMMTTMMQK